MAIRKFRRQVQRSRSFGDLRRKRYSEKPSDKRRRRANAVARRRRQREMRHRPSR